jgi:hypothetical protein
MNVDDDTINLRAVFPNMPDEVMNEWLKPYVQMLGWPPPTDKCELPQGRWRGILSIKPVAFWARVRWRFEEGSLEFDDLDAETQQTLFRLGEAHYCGKQNEYSEITDGKQRLLNIFKYVFQHGNIPSSIIFLEVGLKLSVIDGYHRLVAYFLNQKPEFRKLLPNGAHVFDSKLRKWIGTA